jgi:hypothetical protein
MIYTSVGQLGRLDSFGAATVHAVQTPKLGGVSDLEASPRIAALECILRSDYRKASRYFPQHYKRVACQVLMALVLVAEEAAAASPHVLLRLVRVVRVVLRPQPLPRARVRLV